MKLPDNRMIGRIFTRFLDANSRDEVPLESMADCERAVDTFLEEVKKEIYKQFRIGEEE